MSSDWSTDSGMIEKIIAESKYIKINGLEADIKKWSKMSSWTVMQAVFIFHGIDPMRGLQDKYLKHLSIYKNIMDSYDIMMSAASDKKIPYEGDPALFIDWAELVGLRVSEELKDAVHDEGVKRDFHSLEKQVRMEEMVASLEGDANPAKLAERLFTVDTNKEIRESFHKEIRCLLVELSEAGEQKPTGAEMRSYLEKNPQKAPRFRGVHRSGDLLYESDAAGETPAEMTRQALHKLIDRYTSTTE